MLHPSGKSCQEQFSWKWATAMGKWLILDNLFQQMLSNTATHLCFFLIRGLFSCPSLVIIAFCLRTMFQTLLWHFWCLLRQGRKVKFKPTNEQDVSLCFVLEQNRFSKSLSLVAASCSRIRPLVHAGLILRLHWVKEPFLPHPTKTSWTTVLYKPRRATAH